MRIVNLLTALTLRKIEDDMIAPFNVMDIHHILDEQISQDAIIAMFENKNLALAIETGDMRPLWIESADKPLLRKGFEQQWIQRFITTPFDPICIMLAMRAKYMLDAIDELGHSYNLLRNIGFGWIDFGEIEGEEPGDPDSYIPPGIDAPIDAPVIPGDQAPENGDPVPGPGEPGYIAPGDLQPGDPGYTTTPGSPGYIPPGDLMPGDPGYVAPVGAMDHQLPLWDKPMYRAGYRGIGLPLNLMYGPGAILGGGSNNPNDPPVGINCCLNRWDPDLDVDIGSITNEIKAGEHLHLTVEHAKEECDGENFEWVEVNDCGTLSAETGLAVVYTAPATGANCPGNADICLICGGDVVDTLRVEIDYEYAISFIYEDPEPWLARSNSMYVYVDGNGAPYTWSVVGTDFSMEFAETESKGNQLFAGPAACGSAKITCTDCDGNYTIGFIRCSVGQWVACGSAPIVRCAGGGNCLAVCSGYYGGGSWYAKGHMMSHESLFAMCGSGTDEANAGIWDQGDFFGPAMFSPGMTAPYNANGDAGKDPIAYYFSWGC